MADGSSTDHALTNEPIRVRPAWAVPTLAEDVARAFAHRPRELSPKYFYDARGSALFDAICEQPEYYPTRTEAALLEAHAEALIQQARPQHVVELGSGTARKTETLLAACERSGLRPAYWPFDVCPEVVEESAERLGARFPWLRVQGLVGDYTAGLRHLPRPAGRCLFVFLGGTIGNFTEADGAVMLREIARRMGPQDRLLLGADRVKDRSTLEAAYDDAAGVTAEFNRNVLWVLNRALGGDLDPEGFGHRAWYNELEERIEMHLEALRPQEVHFRVLASSFEFAAGETLRTEISRKFSAPRLGALLDEAGLAVVEEQQDADFPYSVTLCVRP